MITRLTGLDGISLHGETAVMPTHLMAVLFCDPVLRGDLTARAITRWLAERTSATEIFRQRLLGKPLALGQPVWVEDPKFDADAHIHRVRLPEPGTINELAALVGELHGHRLDRDRPLWEAWVVQGLNDGRLAVLIKFSHAMADGVGAVTSILPELVSADPDHEFPAPPERAPTQMPGLSELLGDLIDEVAANTAAGVRFASRLVAAESATGSIPGAMRRMLARAGRRGCDATEGQGNSPRTTLNAPITARRSAAFAAVAMDDLGIIADAFEVTVNDVFLAATTSALRGWLHQQNTATDGSLRTFMPISTRGTPGAGANRWSPTVVNLPVELSDPVEQLTAIHATTARIKNRHRSARSADLTDVIDLVPPLVIAAAAGVYAGLKLSRLHSPLAHLITSNVPGPAGDMYIAGARVLGMHPIAPLCEGSNLNITAVSYGGSFCIGLVACPDNVGDIDLLARGIEDAVGALKAAAAETGRCGERHRCAHSETLSAPA